MNLLANSKFKIVNRFLILMMVFVFSCDDIFVEDISSYFIQIKAPSSGWQGKDPNVNFSWAEVPGAVNYQLEVATPSFSVNHKLVIEKILETVKFDTILNAGEYEWRIRAMNSASETAFLTSSFTILHPLNIESKQVSLKIPEDQFLSKTSVVDFSWDAVEGASFYSFKIKKINWTGDSVVVATLYSTNFNFRLDDGDYNWGVAAVDTLTNKKTDYSIRSFTVDKSPPSIPILLLPSDRDTLHSQVVRFNWHKTESNATYSIEIYSDPELKNKVVEKTIADTATYISIEGNGYYYWKVKSMDKNENSSSFSTVSSFYIQLPVVIMPLVVKLISPADKSMVVNKNVTFWWTSVIGAEKYNLQIVSPSFANPLNLISDQWVKTNSLAFELEPGNYEWRVKAANSTSETGYSQSSLSIYDNDLTKQKTTLLKPFYSELLNNSLVKLSWQKLNNSAAYHLLIKKDSWESGTIVKEMNTNNTEAELSFSEGEFYWGVKAVDLQNNSETEYSVGKFVVDVTIPEVPILKMPVNNFITEDLLFDFGWVPSDATDDKLTFTLEMYQILGNSVIQLEAKITQQKSVEYMFEKAGKYKWRVNATDIAGNKSGFSEYRNFEISDVKDLTGSVVAQVTPTDKSTVIDNKVTFWWTNVSGAEKYNIQIVSPSFANPLKLISDQWLTTNLLALELEPGNYEWKVKAANSTSETGYSQSSFSIYNNDLTKQKTTLLKPSYAELIKTPTVKLSWEKLNANANYHLLIKKDSWESGTFVQELNTSNQEAELTCSDGEYFWGVKAVDPQNNSETAYSVRKFLVDFTSPEIPILKSPANNFITKDLLVDFSWEPLDVNDAKLSYTFEVYQILINSVIQMTPKTTQQKSIVYSFEKSGKYKWRVSATDNAGNKSVFSEYRNFEISNVKDLSGSVVSLMTPANSSTLIDQKVTFWWTNLIGAEKYNIQIVSPSFANPLKLITDQWITSNSLTSELEAGNYEWRVMAANSTSETGFSQSSFIIYDNDLTKQKTTLFNPLYAEVFNHSVVMFSWEKINSNANYHLLIKKDSWETGTIVQEMNTTNTSKDLPFLDGKYFWGIKAVDPQNSSETPYSVRQFEIDLIVPEIPKLKSPANNLIGTDYLIEFSWDPGDAADANLTYTLEIYKGISSVATQLASKATQQKTLGYNFESAGKYLWRVLATDKAGNRSAFSEYRYLEIQ